MLCFANYCDTYSYALRPNLLSAAGHRENSPLVQYKCFSFLSSSKIHAALGLDKPLAIEAFGSVSTGAAPIAPSTLAQLKSIGIVPLELYGCSETSGPTAANTRSKLNLVLIQLYIDTLLCFLLNNSSYIN